MSDRILALVAISVILAMVLGTSLQLRKPQSVSPLLVEMVLKAKVARPVVDAVSVDAEGRSMPFNSRIKRATVINFWASWCLPCVRELPTIGAFQKMADAAGIDVITVSEDKEGAAPALKLLEEKGLKSLPLVVDADGSLAKAMNVRGMPTTIITDAKGNEVARMEGEVDWSQKATLDTVLALLEIDAPAR